MHKKPNQRFNILKVQCFKDPIPKFEQCLRKIGDFIMPESCAILLSKVVFESRSQNVWLSPDDIVLWTRYEIVIWRRVRKYKEEGVLRRWHPQQTKLYKFEQHPGHKNASVSCESSCEGQMGEICPKK